MQDNRPLFSKKYAPGRMLTIHLETYSIARQYPTPRRIDHGGKNRAIPSKHTAGPLGAI